MKKVTKRATMASAQSRTFIEQPGLALEPSIGSKRSSHLTPARTTSVFESYWKFAVERQRIFFLRATGSASEWTTHPVLKEFKFTNAYRASDRVSQFLIRNVIYRADLPNEPDEVVFRILLFKLFNKIDTWQLLEHELKGISLSMFRYSDYDRVLSRAMSHGRRIYSAAYIMHPGKSAFGKEFKHQNHLLLLERMFRDEIGSRLSDAKTMQQGFEILKAYPTLGDFLAYQFVTDINYSEVTNFSEMEFVVPGPGARDGIRKCFSDLGGLTEAEIIRLMADRQEDEFARLNLTFASLWGRPLQLIDCQNLFCEIDKFARVAHPETVGHSGRTRIKQKFNPSPSPIPYWYPPKWGLNDRIAANAIPNEAFASSPFISEPKRKVA